MSIGEVTYETAGVSINAQNRVNSEVMKMLKEHGMRAEGFFGGAVDITRLIGLESCFVGVSGSSLKERENTKMAGTLTTLNAFNDLPRNARPLAALDYFASPNMNDEIRDFVEGVALSCIDNKIPVIGGESAQMPGTYKEGRRDAFVHIIYYSDSETADAIDIIPLIRGMRNPLLVGSTDGVGTKTRIVQDASDIINHGCNDIGAQGTRPIAFALYVAGNVEQKQLDDIVAKSRVSCNALGLTPLKPIINLNRDIYMEGEVDIAGTVLGVIDSGDLITGKNVKEGDLIIGLRTDCLMTNGYSLARKYRDMLKKDLGHDPESRSIPELAGTSVNDELRKTHRPYIDILFGTGGVEGILSAFKGKKGKIKATAHITGGGQKDNILRMVPEGLCAEVTRGVLPLPPIVEYFRHYGADIEAMCEAFNMGVGFTIIVDHSVAGQFLKYINTHFRHAIPGVDRAAGVIGVIKSSQQGEKFRYVANASD